jgi:hypothetical protein
VNDTTGRLLVFGEGVAQQAAELLDRGRVFAHVQHDQPAFGPTVQLVDR